LITVTVGHDLYPMRPGDALQFPADRPHRFANSGDGDASFLLI
jgi:quercetin dioxygenase-like cupin family protein